MSPHGVRPVPAPVSAPFSTSPGLRSRRVGEASLLFRSRVSRAIRDGCPTRTAWWLALLLLIACTLAGAQEDDYALQADKWDCRRDGGDCAWAAEALEIIIPAGRQADATATCRTPIKGDFQATVKFELLDWNGGMGRSAAMQCGIVTAPETRDTKVETVRIGRDWTGPLDQFESAIWKDTEWKYPRQEMSVERSGKLQIHRRGSLVQMAYQAGDPETAGWNTMEIYSMWGPVPVKLYFTASNAAGRAEERTALRVRFTELEVQMLPPLPKGKGGLIEPPAEGEDWVVYATGPGWQATEDPLLMTQQRRKIAGWLRIGTRTDFERPMKRSEEIWGGNSEEPLPRVLLQEGLADRAEALSFLCDRLTKVVARYNATATPKETVTAIFGDAEYHLRLDRGNDPDAVLFRGEEYDFGAEVAILRDHGITPRIGFRKLWLVHATGHGTTQGPVADDAWMMIASCPRPDPKQPEKGVFVISDGFGGTFTYSCDQWEGPYRDNFGLAKAMNRLGVREVTLARTESGYERRIVAADVPDNAVDHGKEVLGVQPIVDPPELRDWVIYATADRWLHIGTRQEFSTPVKARETIWSGLGEDAVQKALLSGTRHFGSYDYALAELVKGLTNVRCGFHPNTEPRETVDGTYNGKEYILHIARSPDEAVVGYGGYSFWAEFELMVSQRIVPLKHFGKQWLVHATGHGTYSGPVKDDFYMMVTSEPKDGGVTIPDGMGGTFGYSVDVVEGPFDNSLDLAKALQAKGVKSVGLAGGSGRTVSADEIVLPPKPPKEEPPKIISITPDYGEPGTTFYVTVVATGMKPGYGFRFGPGVTVFDETCLGKNPDGEGERWLATIVVDKDTTFRGN